MLYDSLKIIHIISAAILLASMISSVRCWATTANTEKIQTQTLWLILPMALLQLLTGFTLISLHHENPLQLWIQISFSGFLILMLSWFVFSYVNSRKLQGWMLLMCGVGLVMMIFAMSNK